MPQSNRGGFVPQEILFQFADQEDYHLILDVDTVVELWLGVWVLVGLVGRDSGKYLGEDLVEVADGELADVVVEEEELSEYSAAYLGFEFVQA